MLLRHSLRLDGDQPTRFIIVVGLLGHGDLQVHCVAIVEICPDCAESSAAAPQQGDARLLWMGGGRPDSGDGGWPGLSLLGRRAGLTAWVAD